YSDVTAMRYASIVTTPLALNAWIPGSAYLNQATWSISSEFFFYFSLPFLMAYTVSRPLRAIPAIVLAWIVLVGATAAAWAIWGEGSIVGPDPQALGQAMLQQFVKFFPVLRIPEFLLGIALYGLWRLDARQRAAWPLLVAGVAILILLV